MGHFPMAMLVITRPGISITDAGRPGEHDLGAQHGGDQARGHTFGTWKKTLARGWVVVVGYNMYVIYLIIIIIITAIYKYTLK